MARLHCRMLRCVNVFQQIGNVAKGLIRIWSLGLETVDQAICLCSDLVCRASGGSGALGGCISCLCGLLELCTSYSCLSCQQAVGNVFYLGSTLALSLRLASWAESTVSHCTETEESFKRVRASELFG